MEKADQMLTSKLQDHEDMIMNNKDNKLINSDHDRIIALGNTIQKNVATDASIPLPPILSYKNEDEIYTTLVNILREYHLPSR